MSSYAFWNNKGGVGKSFLCFIAGCEYANWHGIRSWPKVSSQVFAPL